MKCDELQDCEALGVLMDSIYSIIWSLWLCLVNVIFMFKKLLTHIQV